MKAGLLVLVATVCVAGSALAVKPAITKDYQEVNLSGIVNDDGNNFGAGLDWRYGAFVRDGLELGGFADLGFRGSDSLTVGLGAMAEYDIYLGSPVVPFGGMDVGAVVDDWEGEGGNSTTSFYLKFGFRAGAKYFFVDYAAFTADAEFWVATAEALRADHSEQWDLLVKLGMSWYF